MDHLRFLLAFYYTSCFGKEGLGIAFEENRGSLRHLLLVRVAKGFSVMREGT